MLNSSLIVKRLKHRMLDVAYKNQVGFLASSFSAMDIMVVLYYFVMKKDEFVLSKGHAAFGLYAILEDRGILQEGELESIGKYGSRLSLMADRGRTPGVLFSTGSLGHGFPEAVGLAYGRHIQKKEGKVYVLVGDGELNEGTNWECFLAVPQMGLDNLVCIIDNNQSSKAIKINNYSEMLKTFRWNVVEIDGHDEKELLTALAESYLTPTVIIANTMKGRGCKTMEENPGLWHSKPPTKEEYEMLKEELDRYGEAVCE